MLRSHWYHTLNAQSWGNTCKFMHNLYIAEMWRLDAIFLLPILFEQKTGWTQAMKDKAKTKLPLQHRQRSHKSPNFSFRVARLKGNNLSCWLLSCLAALVNSSVEWCYTDVCCIYCYNYEMLVVDLPRTLFRLMSITLYVLYKDIYILCTFLSMFLRHLIHMTRDVRNRFFFSSVFEKTRIQFEISLVRFDIIVIYYTCDSCWVVNLQQILQRQWTTWLTSLSHSQRQQVNNVIAFYNLSATLLLWCYLMQVKLLLVTFYLNGGFYAVYIGKPSEWMLNFWTVWLFKNESEPNFGFPHILTHDH